MPLTAFYKAKLLFFSIFISSLTVSCSFIRFNGLERYTEKSIDSFVFKAEDNPALLKDVMGEIQGGAVKFELPQGTPLTSLVPTITFSGKSIMPASGTARDFTTPQDYVVKAADSTATVYRVVVDYDPNEQVTDYITGFNFRAADNGGNLSTDVTGTIVAGEINLTVPYNTDLTALVPEIKLVSGVTVSPGSGVAQNFTNPIEYWCTLPGQPAQNYLVTVTKKAELAKEITAFKFRTAENGFLLEDVIGDVSGDTITVTLPYWTEPAKLSSLRPHIIYTAGTTLTPGSGTAQDFSSPVEYKLTAADGSSRVYRVTIKVANPAEGLFCFRAIDHSGLLPKDVPGTLSGDDSNIVTAFVPYGTDYSALKPTITLPPGWSTSPASGVVQNFSLGPVNYTVTDPEGSETIFSVVVMMGAEQPKSIAAFVFEMGHNSGNRIFNDVLATINGNMINVVVPDDVELNGLKPSIVYDGESITPGHLEPCDFSGGNLVTYKVTAPDGTYKVFYVNISKVNRPQTTDSRLTVTEPDAGRVRIEWKAATDSTTPQESIEYKAVYSAAPITSLLEAESATLIMDWRADSLTAETIGVPSATTCYFAVISRDSDGNRLLYTPRRFKTN